MHEVNLLQCKNSYSSGDCGQDLWPGKAPKQEEEPKARVFWRMHAGTQCRELGRPFPFPLPGERELPQVPRSPASPARPWRARVSAVTSPHPAPKCEPAVAGPARGKAAPGAGTGVVPSPAGPGSAGARSPRGRQRPSWALPQQRGGEGGAGEASRPRPRAPRGPLLLGRKARPAPPRARGRSALCW